MDANIDLRRLLLRLPKDGKAFEDLIRRALEKVLGRRVWAAQTGSQFGRDMGTSEVDWPVIKLEAKRWKSNLSKTELLGKISDSVASCPGLDLWVLATTAEVPEQLEEALKKQGELFGIGVEILDISPSEHSKLPQLLAFAIPEVCTFLEKRIDKAEAQEVRSILEEVRERQTLEALRSKLFNATSLFDSVAQVARESFRRRLQEPAEARKHFDQKLPGKFFVRRQSAFTQLQDWYSENQNALFVLCGEEGMGKTWVAADWLSQKLENSSLLPVVLPSSQAAVIDNIAQGIADYLHKLLPQTAASSWQRRVERWMDHPPFRSRLFLLVDGLNEQPEADWRRIIDQLLEEAEAEERTLTKSSRPRAMLATLVTCRTQFWDKHFADMARWPVRKVELSRFTNNELRAYLNQHGHSLDQFNSEILPLLRIPRYSDLVVQHYDELVASGDIAKDRLLYEDWKDRYQRRSGFPLDDSSFQAEMKEVARRALEGKRRYRESDFRKGQFPPGRQEKILTELITGGVFVTGEDGALHVDKDRLHHALGLLLLSELENNEDKSQEELQEIVSKHFEPGGLDSHAAICAAAIFGATTRNVSNRLVLLLFSAFFSLQNIQEAEWQKIRGYFPAFPEIYRQIAERFVTEQHPPGQAWEVVNWAYLRWCDDQKLRPIIEKHCQRWLSFIPLKSPWTKPNWSGPGKEEKDEEYAARLRLLMGKPAQVGAHSVNGREFVFVDTYKVSRLYGLAFKLLSADPSRVDPKILCSWAIAATTQQHLGHAASVTWLVRFMDASKRAQLVTEIGRMLEVDNPIWQEAAHILAGMIPDGQGKQFQEQSTYEPRNFFWERHEKDPCDVGVYRWLEEDCMDCLRRPDVDIETKASNLSLYAPDPGFALPEDLSGSLKSELQSLAATIDADEVFRFQATSISNDMKTWNTCLSRWIPDALAAVYKSIVGTFSLDACRLIAAEQDPNNGNEESSIETDLNRKVQELEDLVLILSKSDFESLRRFWREYSGRPLESRTQDSIDFLEYNLFRVLLLLADPEDYAELVRERSKDEFQARDFIDAQPSGLRRERLADLWEEIFRLPQEEIIPSLFYFALDRPALSDEQRRRLVNWAQQEAGQVISIFSLLSGDADLTTLLLEEGSRFDIDFISGAYWRPVNAFSEDISFGLMEWMPATLLSHFIAKRESSDAFERFACKLRDFVKEGQKNWYPWGQWGKRDSRGWCGFSQLCVRKTLGADPRCLDDLLEVLEDAQVPYSPIKHSFRLYHALCKYLLDTDKEEAIELLDKLISEQYIGNNTTAVPHAVTGLMARYSEVSGVSERLSRCLNACVRDSSLQSFALAFEPDGDSWLWQKIQSDLATERPILIARALTLAGFARNSEKSSQVLRRNKQEPDSWLEAVRKSSLDLAERANWSKHWFEQFLVEEGRVVSWANFRIFADCVDRRFYGWYKGLLGRHGFSYRDRSLKMRHFRANHGPLLKKIEEREKKSLEKKFCHSSLEERIFPWMKECRLSEEDARKILTGD